MASQDPSPLAIAREHCHQGRLGEARELLTALLAEDPGAAPAHALLGVCLLKEGRRQEALDALDRALALAPEDNEAAFNRGIALKLLARYSEAAAVFQDLAQRDTGDLAADVLFQLALVLQAQGRHREAIPIYRRLLAQVPDHHLAALNLGTALRECDQPKEAVIWLTRAVELQPHDAVYHNNLGLALQEAGRLDEAIAAFRRALDLDPRYAEPLANWGNCLLEEDRIDEAKDRYRQAIALDENFHEAWYNLGNACLAANEVAEAERHYRRAITLKPDLVQAHWNLSLALLLAGRYQEGFLEYRWRWRRPQAVRFAVERPTWQGECDPDLTLLVHTEQGLGDAIQFVRYLPLARARVGRLILACQQSLHRLFQGLAGVDLVVLKKDPERLAALVDVQVPLLDLPAIFATDGRTIPADIPYLKAETSTVAATTPLLQKADPLPCHAGLVWRGNPAHRNDHRRSLSLEVLSPLFDLPGIRWYSLQKDRQEPLPTGIIDLAPRLEDFAATAAVMHHLDLVVSVDTAPAHLAGALGRPVWLLLPFAPDWRWQVRGETTPWYPTMRLFRQPRPGDWQTVIAAVTEHLQRWTPISGGDEKD